MYIYLHCYRVRVQGFPEDEIKAGHIVIMGLIF